MLAVAVLVSEEIKVPLIVIIERVKGELTLLISKLSGLALALLKGIENKVNPTDKVAISNNDIFLIFSAFS